MAEKYQYKEFYIARDADNLLYLYEEKPVWNDATRRFEGAGAFALPEIAEVFAFLPPTGWCKFSNLSEIYLVLDEFNGTDSDCGHGAPHAVYSDELIAKAVAQSCYLHSVEEFEVQREVPDYARAAYERLLKEQKKGKK